MPLRATARVAIPFLLAISALTTAPAAQQSEWLSLCGQCLSPSVTSKSGIGTAHAVAEAKITRKDAEAWCENWQPGADAATCVKGQLSSDEAKKIYRASADCTQGRIAAIDGNSYTQAGVWTSDVGKGRSRWRDSGGKIVGQDDASGGLAIAQQWELLCPAAAKASKAAAAPASSAAPRKSASAAPAAPAAPRAAAEPALAPAFAVGEIVEAKFGSQWIRGTVRKIRQTQGCDGPELNYDIALDNGQRGVLPAKMVRKAQ